MLAAAAMVGCFIFGVGAGPILRRRRARDRHRAVGRAASARAAVISRTSSPYIQRAPIERTAIYEPPRRRSGPWSRSTASGASSCTGSGSSDPAGPASLAGHHRRASHEGVRVLTSALPTGWPFASKASPRAGIPSRRASSRGWPRWRRPACWGSSGRWSPRKTRSRPSAARPRSLGALAPRPGRSGDGRPATGAGGRPEADHVEGSPQHRGSGRSPGSSTKTRWRRGASVAPSTVSST